MILLRVSLGVTLCLLVASQMCGVYDERFFFVAVVDAHGEAGSLPACDGADLADEAAEWECAVL